MDKYDIRHKTLAILCDKQYKVCYDSAETANQYQINADLLDIKITELIQILGVSEYEFRRANTTLSHLSEIEYRLNGEGNEVISLQPAGLVAFEERKYLKQRYEERNEMIHSFTKWTIPVISLILSCAALWFSCNGKNGKPVYIYLQLQDTAVKQSLILDSAKIAD